MALTAEEIAANRAKLAAKMKNSGQKVGNSRRKKKTTNKDSNAGDNKNLTAALKKLGANQIPGIEEVNMFTDDGNVIHFKKPTVQVVVLEKWSQSGDSRRISIRYPKSRNSSEISDINRNVAIHPKCRVHQFRTNPKLITLGFGLFIYYSLYQCSINNTYNQDY